MDNLPVLGADLRGQRPVGRSGDVQVGRDGAEVTLDPFAGDVGLEVAHDRQHCVVRSVIGAEEGLDILQRGGVQILHRADRRMVVRVALREHRRLEPLRGAPVGPVVVALALLVLDDLALVVEGLLAEGVEQAPHAVGLQPEGQLEVVARDRLVVVGAVDPGGAVERPAGAGDQAEVLGLADVAGALEHHVLEEVGEPGLARPLVPGADVVPDVDGGHGCERVGGHDQAQPVAETLIGEAHLRPLPVAGPPVARRHPHLPHSFGETVALYGLSQGRAAPRRPFFCHQPFLRNTGWQKNGRPRGGRPRPSCRVRRRPGRLGCASGTTVAKGDGATVVPEANERAVSSSGRAPDF